LKIKSTPKHVKIRYPLQISKAKTNDSALC